MKLCSSGEGSVPLYAVCLFVFAVGHVALKQLGYTETVLKVFKKQWQADAKQKQKDTAHDQEKEAIEVELGMDEIAASEDKEAA